MTTDKITQKMEVIGADGVHVGTVDGIANGRIRRGRGFASLQTRQWP